MRWHRGTPLKGSRHPGCGYFYPGFPAGRGIFLGEGKPLYDPDGNITGAIETIRDITERPRWNGNWHVRMPNSRLPQRSSRVFFPNIPGITGFDIAARSVMAKEVGGDFFDVIPFEIIPLEMGTYGILIADVSGKGVPAALFMALSRIVVRVNALWHRDPAKAIGFANDIITQDSKAGMFVTLFYGSFLKRTGP